jgi:CheY-like chemotaxis protein
MHFLIVEDDKLQFSYIKNGIRQGRYFSESRIERIATEWEFIGKFESLATEKPDVILLDIMLRWTDPAPDMTLPPADIAEEGFFRAGVRCEQRLAVDPRTRNIPVIVYSILEKTDFDGEIRERPEVHYLEKNFGVEELNSKLEECLLYTKVNLSNRRK